MGESTLLCSDASATATLNNSNNKLQQQQLLQPPEKKKTRNNNQCSGIHTLIFVGQKLTKFKTKKLIFACYPFVCWFVPSADCVRSSKAPEIPLKPSKRKKKGEKKIVELSVIFVRIWGQFLRYDQEEEAKHGHRLLNDRFGFANYRAAEIAFLRQYRRG